MLCKIYLIVGKQEKTKTMRITRGGGSADMKITAMCKHCTKVISTNEILILNNTEKVL